MVFAGASCAAYVFVLLLFLLLSAQLNYLDAGKSAALGWSEVSFWLSQVTVSQLFFSPDC
jgi:hypothetical protein